MQQKLIRKYANLIATKGINLKENQQVCIYAPVSAYKFVEILTSELYKNKAKKVLIKWNDKKIHSLENKYQSIETLKELPKHIKEEAKYFYDHQIARISISSNNYDKDIKLDLKKLAIENKSKAKLNKYLSKPYMDSLVQWCVVAVPNPSWAKKVFPNVSISKAMNLLWEAILKANYVTLDNDPLAIWQQHDSFLHQKAQILNDYNFDYLKYEADNGTNFTIGLVKDHIWAGGSETDIYQTINFNPNMPTEEVFTMPHRNKVNGKVVATKPLYYQGQLIEDFYLVFKDGKVIEAKALKGQEFLDNLLKVDEGSSYLGEVALVPYHSPINELNILFYNTLFDENASCHLALGNAYSMNIKDGVISSEKQLIEKGYNSSLIHVDFMIGSSSLKIIGVKGKKEIPIFIDGDYVI